MNLLLVCFFAVFPQATSDRLAIQQESVVLREIVLPTSEFDVNTIEARLRAILQQKDSQTKVLKVEIKDNDDVSLQHKGVIDGNYTTWKNLFSDLKEREGRIPPFAELVVIGNNAAMRLRDDQGRVFKKVLQGNDPYAVHTNTTQLDLVHLSVTLTGIPKREGLFAQLTFFLVATAPTDKLAARMAFDKLQAATSMQMMSVVIRQDPWFILDSNFPVVSPFLSEIDPPSQEEFESSAEWTCISSERGINCWGWPERESER